MATLRETTHFLLDSYTAGEDIDLSDGYDKVGRFKNEGQIYLCGADESPQVLILSSAEAGEPVRVAFLGMGQVQLGLSGTGNKGDKLRVGAGGIIKQSSRSQTEEQNADDIGISFENWFDGDKVECLLLKGDKA